MIVLLAPGTLTRSSMSIESLQAGALSTIVKFDVLSDKIGKLMNSTLVPSGQHLPAILQAVADCCTEEIATASQWQIH